MGSDGADKDLGSELLDGSSELFRSFREPPGGGGRTSMQHRVHAHQCDVTRGQLGMRYVELRGNLDV